MQGIRRGALGDSQSSEGRVFINRTVASLGKSLEKTEFSVEYLPSRKPRVQPPTSLKEEDKSLSHLEIPRGYPFHFCCVKLTEMAPTGEGALTRRQGCWCSALEPPTSITENKFPVLMSHSLWQFLTAAKMDCNHGCKDVPVNHGRHLEQYLHATLAVHQVG